MAKSNTPDSGLYPLQSRILPESGSEDIWSCFCKFTPQVILMAVDSYTIIGLLSVQFITLILGLHYLNSWLERRSERLDFWMAAWCFTALGFQGSRMLHHLSETTELASWMTSVGTAATLLMLVPLMVICQLLTSTSGERLNRAMAAVIGVGIALTVTTSLVVTGAVRHSYDVLGQCFLWVEPGPLMWILPLIALPGLWYCIRLLQRSNTAGRHVLFGGLIAFVALGLNDFLAGHGIATMPLFEYGWALLAMALNHVVARSSQHARVAAMDAAELVGNNGLSQTLVHA